MFVCVCHFLQLKLGFLAKVMLGGVNPSLRLKLSYQFTPVLLPKGFTLCLGDAGVSTHNGSGPLAPIERIDPREEVVLLIERGECIILGPQQVGVMQM